MLFNLISETTHGYIDYATALALPVVPRLLGYDETVTHLHEAVGAATLGNAALTDFPLGIVKAIPMKAHLALDAVTGAGLLATAAAMDEECASARSLMSGLGLFYLFMAFCTKTSSGRNALGKRLQRQPDAMANYAASRRPEAGGDFRSEVTRPGAIVDTPTGQIEAAGHI